MKWATVTDDARYVVEDADLGGATISRTTLHPGKSTRGHSHDNAEAYLFVEGEAQITIGADEFHAMPGSVYAINPGDFHRVSTIGGCVFMSLFIGERAI